MKKAFISRALTAAVLFVFASSTAFAQSRQFTLPSAGFTPESSFYFLDTFGETLRGFFVFNPEDKARLQIAFAAERIAEIKAILKTKGVETKGLLVAESRIQANFAVAGAIFDKEKSKGKDVSRLAKELGDKFEDTKSALEETFKDKERVLENQEDELKAKIRAARQAGDTAQVEGLITELGLIKAQEELLEQKEDELEDALEREEERIEKELDVKADAEKKIRKAEREKQKVLDEAAEEGVTVPPEAFNAFEQHLSEARSALAAGKFEEAKHHAKEAKKSLDAAEDAMDDLEQAKEKEAERLEKEMEKADKDAEKQAQQEEKLKKEADKKPDMAEIEKDEDEN